MTVYLLATLDTKGEEANFVRERLQAAGVETCLVDTSCIGDPAVPADIPREDVYAAAGADLAEVQKRGDRGEAISLAAAGASQLISQKHQQGEVSGVLGQGGSAGTTIGTAAMRALPLGVPKLMVSTLASGQVRQYVGDKDICMLNSVVDISGVNRVSRKVLGNAAAAMAGMVKAPATEASSDRPLIAASMFGVTTPCVEAARKILEDAGYEVLVFHATGNGGMAMESLIADGLVAGVLDITTTELADELVGGVLSAGPDRLTAAGKAGVPQLISVGALDMVNFHAPESMPPEFADRKIYRHNPTVTLMRTTAEENAELGRQIAAKACAAAGPTCVLLPQQGVSAIDKTDQPFDDPAARNALFDELRAGLADAPANVEVRELDLHINDPKFAQAAAESLLAMIKQAAH